MQSLFELMLARLTAGEDAALCLILEAAGSSPRGAGAGMAVFSDGSSAGTVGGGAVELLALKQAAALLAEGENSWVRQFDLGAPAGQRTGMICGGWVRICCRRFSSPQDIPLLQQLCRIEQTGQSGWLVLTMEENSISAAACDGVQPPPDWAPLLRAGSCYQPGSPSIFVQPLGARGRVCLFGAGHVGQALVPFLHAVGFQVVVYDDRPALLTADRFPLAAQLVQGSFAAISLTLTQEDYAVVMTAGHQADFVVLHQLLSTPAAYIGCIGSRGKAETVRQRLLGAGWTEGDLARIYSPIGLPIGGEAPAEIAVSVTAQLIQCRTRREGGRHVE